MKAKIKTYGTKFRIDGDSRMYSTTRKFKGRTPGAALAMAANYIQKELGLDVVEIYVHEGDV